MFYIFLNNKNEVLIHVGIEDRGTLMYMYHMHTLYRNIHKLTHYMHTISRIPNIKQTGNLINSTVNVYA